MKFYTQWDRPEGLEVEMVSDRSITEMAHVPAQIQIRDMMNAGIRLAAERRLRFDRQGQDPDDDIPLDVTREPGVDLVEVSRELHRLQARLKASQAEKEAAAEAAKKAAEEAAKPVDVPPKVETK